MLYSMDRSKNKGDKVKVSRSFSCERVDSMTVKMDSIGIVVVKGVPLTRGHRW